MNEEKRTLVIGVSPNPERYSHKAVLLLTAANIPHVAYGKRKGVIGETSIKTNWEGFKNIHTVTLYVGPQNQAEALRQNIIALHPTRVIFNPGTENPVFVKELKENGIEVEIACTLVLIRTGQY